MTPSDHVTSAAVRFFSFKLAALHKSGRLFQCEATPRKAAQARRVTVALAKCQLTWLVMVTVSPFVTVSSLFPGSAVKSYKTCPFEHSRHKTNNFNIDEWQQGWIIVHERRQACFSERGNPPYSTASAAAESQRTLKAGPTSSSSSVLLTRQQDTAASRYRPRSGAGSSLLFWPTSTERHFPRGPRWHTHTKTNTRMHEWVVTTWKQV